MPNLVLEQADLYGRGSTVSEILKPLTGKDRPAFQFKKQANAIVIGIHDGSPPASHYRDWRFSTKVHHLAAMYYEVWPPVSGSGAHYYLAKAYLHIYRARRPGDESEILALHCDPSEEPGAERPELVHYKRAPHLHIRVAEHPIPNAHLCMVAGDIELLLRTPSSLTDGFARCVEMIAEEVLQRYAAL